MFFIFRVLMTNIMIGYCNFDEGQERLYISLDIHLTRVYMAGSPI